MVGEVFKCLWGIRGVLAIRGIHLTCAMSSHLPLTTYRRRLWKMQGSKKYWSNQGVLVEKRVRPTAHLTVYKALGEVQRLIPAKFTIHQRKRKYNNDSAMDLESRIKAYRFVAYSAVTFSVVAVLSVCVTLPMVYNYVSHVRRQMNNEITFCRARFTSLHWFKKWFLECQH